MMRAKKKVVVSVHGIQTRGAWQKDLASVVSEEGWIYFPLDYGHFSGLRFVVPSARRAKIAWFRESLNALTPRFHGVRPSIVAHSNGTYIVAEALFRYPGLCIDKLILCGSIVRRDFPWTTIFQRKQATLVRNDIGGRDFWSGVAGSFARDTGASGKRGFATTHRRLVEEQFGEYTHSDVFGYEHYVQRWMPFLERLEPYEGDSQAPGYDEEPVSPYDAARWSAMTYFHQYVRRVTDAIAAGEVFGASSEQPLAARALVILVPPTPGRAAKKAVKLFFRERGLAEGHVGKVDRRSVHYNGGAVLYDVPTILHTLTFLDNRTDEELTSAVERFATLLERLVTGPRSECAQMVRIQELEEVADSLP